MIARRCLMTLALALGSSGLLAEPATPQNAFTTLFDGTSLNGWTRVGDANWTIQDGAVEANKGNGFLLTDKSYGDFELRVEFWYAEDANSGVFIRCTDDKTIDGKTAYEVNLWDTRPEKDYATGAIVGLAKVEPMPKAAGKWGTFDITAKGNVFTVKLNGQTTVNEVVDPKSTFMSGKIALQHGLGNKNANGTVNDRGVVKFRKVEIRPL